MKRGIAFWQIGLAALAVPIAISSAAIVSLQVPETFQCQAGRPASTSGSETLHCAQQVAAEQTPEALADAIQLAMTLPTDHPLSDQRDRRIQVWSLQLLERGEAAFQAGDLDTAIATARLMPSDAPLRSRATQQIDRWQSTCATAKALFAEAKAEMQQDRWQPAFATANKLRSLPNEYWAKTQYQSLVQQIQAAREERDDRLKSPLEPKKVAKQQSKPQPSSAQKAAQPAPKPSQKPLLAQANQQPEKLPSSTTAPAKVAAPRSGDTAAQLVPLLPASQPSHPATLEIPIYSQQPIDPVQPQQIAGVTTFDRGTNSGEHARAASQPIVWVDPPLQAPKPGQREVPVSVDAVQPEPLPH